MTERPNTTPRPGSPRPRWLASRTPWPCWSSSAAGVGRIVGDNVLTLGARGGVYIVGGVVPRFAEFFMHSGFCDALCEKGQMSGYFDRLPVWLVTAPYPGLEGAGVALQSLLEGV